MTSFLSNDFLSIELNKASIAIASLLTVAQEL